MKTDCSTQGTLFADIAGRDAVARFDAGDVTSSAGVLLLERTDRRLDLLRRFAGCFRDHRAARRVEHTVVQMVRQRTSSAATTSCSLICRPPTVMRRAM